MSSGAAAGIVDVDLRTELATTEAIGSYLGRAWRELMRLGEGRGSAMSDRWGLPSTLYQPPPSGARARLLGGPSYTVGAAGPDGDGDGEPADPQAALRARLDADGIVRAILDPGTAGEVSGIGNPALAAEVARATNDWLAEEWLPLDGRLLGSILVAAGDPAAAATEIRRLGGDERFVQVLLAYPQAMLGNRSLRPLFAAADEHGLAVCLQAGGGFTGRNRGAAGPGVPGSVWEYELGWTAGAQPHLLSVVAEGVLAAYPNVRLVLDGFGVAWLPSLLWRMDREFRRGRLPLPRSLDRVPSEVVHERVRFTTAGLEVPEDAERLATLLAQVDGERLLLYASGAGSDDDAVAALPAAWQRRILHDNAVDCFELAAAASR